MAKPKISDRPSITAQRISECRKVKHLSQRELAEKVDVSEGSINRWERCKSYPEPANIIKLAAALDTTTEYLCGHSNIRDSAEQERLERDFWAEFGDELAGYDQWINDCRRHRRVLNCFFKDVCGYTYAEESSAAVDFCGAAPHIFKAQDGTEFRVSQVDFQTMLQRIKEAVDFACLKSAQPICPAKKEGEV